MGMAQLCVMIVVTHCVRQVSRVLAGQVHRYAVLFVRIAACLLASMRAARHCVAAGLRRHKQCCAQQFVPPPACKTTQLPRCICCQSLRAPEQPAGATQCRTRMSVCHTPTTQWGAHGSQAAPYTQCHRLQPSQTPPSTRSLCSPRLHSLLAQGLPPHKASPPAARPNISPRAFPLLSPSAQPSCSGAAAPVTALNKDCKNVCAV
jgi:hypothetical protein